MDEIALYTTLEPLAPWLHAHTAEVAAQAGAATGAPLQVHPPFQGPGLGGGVVLTFAPVVGGSRWGAGATMQPLRVLPLALRWSCRSR